MTLQKNRAFTLLEIIAVITIIVILIALLSPALNTARQQAKKQEAKAMVGSLEVAINMYYTDQGSYPGTLSDLMSPPDPYSPYMDNKHYEGGNFMDPWDNAYNYPGAPTHNPDTFDVWSNGLDEASGNDDDIGNW